METKFSETGLELHIEKMPGMVRIVFDCPDEYQAIVLYEDLLAQLTSPAGVTIRGTKRA